MKGLWGCLRTISLGTREETGAARDAEEKLERLAEVTVMLNECEGPNHPVATSFRLLVLEESPRSGDFMKQSLVPCISQRKLNMLQ